MIAVEEAFENWAQSPQQPVSPEVRYWDDRAGCWRRASDAQSVEAIAARYGNYAVSAVNDEVAPSPLSFFVFLG